jgi:prepilin-type N-terminal cleavage/methylation domain-containing protein
MKGKKQQRQQGFTLIEVIAVLLLMGIVALALATTMVTAVEGYLFTKDSADGAQKAQLALARIGKELLQANTITTATSTTVAYTTPAGSFQIAKNSDVITLEKTDSPAYAPQIMLDNVETNYGTESFLVFEKLDGSTWTPADAINILHAVKITLKLTGASGMQMPTFKTMINPRQNDPQKEKLRNVPRIISKAGPQLLPIPDRDYSHEESCS